MECIQGLRRPDAGTLRVLGLDPVTQADLLRPKVGSQLQSSALPDRLRVGEAVRLFAGRDAGDLIERFGLADRRRSAFASLSGGERQRLFLVLALVNHPRLVILDYTRTTRLESVLLGFYSDMPQLREHKKNLLRPHLRKGARLAYVVGDQASFFRLMIRTGQLLADIAERLGYTVESVDLFRTRLATVTKARLREEVLVLRWDH